MEIIHIEITCGESHLLGDFYFISINFCVSTKCVFLDFTIILSKYIPLPTASPLSFLPSHCI